jgi:NADP-dependent 3-hydroxy acid dehydrogenase YdfG
LGRVESESKAGTDMSQIVLVTGATSVIGRHAAMALARAGHRVFATGRRKEALLTLEQEAAGLRLEAIAMDVTKPASIEEAKRIILERTGGHGVDALEQRKLRQDGATRRGHARPSRCWYG